MFKVPASVIVPALKSPLPSRLTMVLMVSVFVAVVPRVTVPFVVETVMSSSPATERRPALVNVVEPPRATAPPPLKPAPALMVM